MEKLNLYFRGVCDIFSINQGLPYQLWDGATADGGSSLLATRLLHNKPFLYGNEFLRCYFLGIDPYFLVSLTSGLAIAIIILGICMLPQRVKLLFVPILIFPLFFIFSRPDQVSYILSIYRFYLISLDFVTVILLFSQKLRFMYKPQT